MPILLVDDQAANLLALRAVLERPEYEIVTARTGTEAIEHVERAKFAAILLDIQMPGIDGYETARRIKRLENGRDVPIMFMTAIFNEPPDVRRGYEVGALDYFGKPFDEEILRAKVSIYANLFARTSESKRKPPADVAQALRALREPILARWQRLVLDDPNVPEANRLSEPELRDHVPALLAHIADALERSGKRDAPMIAEPSRVHARKRFDANYDVGETLRELAHLRAAVDTVLAQNGVEPDLESMGAIGAHLDQVMRTDAVEMSHAAARELEREAQIRERFLAVLAHDLRQPISSIELGAHFLLDRAIDETSTDVAKRIARIAQRMAGMVGELLDFARTTQAEGMPITPTEGEELRELVKHVVEEIQGAHPEAMIRLKAPRTVKGCWDVARLTQAITNLVHNAVQHGRAGAPITVTVGSSAEGASIAVHNVNRGAPIPRDLIPDLFVPFRQVDPSTARNGLGLGLYIANEVARAHGGEIGVESTEDGTTFELMLPRLAESSALTEELEGHSRAGSR